MDIIAERTIPDLLESKTTRRRRGGRRRFRQAFGIGALLLGLIGAALFANWYVTEGRFIETTDDAYVQGDTAVLSARLNGDVVALPVAENQPVRAGTPLVILDPRDVRARLAQARAQAAQADAASVTVIRQQAEQRAAINAAKAAVAQAGAQRTMAASDASRSGALIKTGAESRQFNDHAEAEKRKADAAMTAAQAQLAASEAQLDVLAAQAQAAQAARASAAAAVQLAQNNLDDTVVRAPFDGIAANRSVQLGQFVEHGQQLIAVTPEAGKLYVTANFKETELRRMIAGMPAVITADIAPDAPLAGTVGSLAPGTGAMFSLLPPENATGNFTRVVQRVPVRIALDPGQAARAGWLRSGLSVTVAVDTRENGGKQRGIIGAARHTVAGLLR